MKTFLCFTFIFLGAAANARPVNFPPVSFIDTTQCVSNADATPACGIYQDKFLDWDPDSIAQVHAAIDEMPSGKMERFLDLIFQGGFKKIVFIKLMGKNMGATFVDGDTAYIALQSAFFETPLKYEKVSEKTHTLVHELVHVYVQYYVGNDFFSAPFWADLISILDWKNAKGFNPLVNVSERDMHLRIRNKYKKLKQYGPAIAEDLDYSRKLGFPSLYSMSRLEEYFCELTAYLIYDPSVQSVPPARVINWYLKTNLGFLFESQTPVDESVQMPERRADNDGQFDFVGILYDEGAPVCTVTILRHGSLQVAQECLRPEWLGGTSGKTKLSYLMVRFYSAKGKEVDIDGSELNDISVDGDLASIAYPAELTSKDIALPIFDFISDTNAPAPANLVTVGYPRPGKLQRYVRMISDCRADVKMCVSWFNTVGSLVFAPSEQPGHLLVWGIIPHTFSVSSGNAYRADKWGSYIYSDFVSLVKTRKVARNSPSADSPN